MKSKAFERLEAGVLRLLERQAQSGVRQEQLSRALAKSRDELERLKNDNLKFKAERTAARKKLDRLVKRLDGLESEEGGDS